MHILFLTDNFPPEVNAPATRTFEHCRLWVRAGHQVTVITCAPNFPKGQVFEGYRNKLWQHEEMDGIRVIRVWTYITANEGFYKRTIDYLSFMVSSVIAALFVRRIDVIVGTSPQFFTAVGAYLTSILKRRPWVFELRDPWPESIKTVGVLKPGRVLDMLEWVEMFLYRRADLIVAVTHSFKTALIDRGIPAAKIPVVTNGTDLSKFSSRPKSDALVAKVGIEGCFVAGYVGTHGLAHALETLLGAAAILQTSPEGKNIRILLLGDGARKAELVRRAREMQLNNVIFLDTVPRSEVRDYWALLDVSIIHLKKDPLYKTVIPSKLFECMAMGIPVLLGVEGEAGAIVADGRVGELFEPEDAATLAEKLICLARDPQALSIYRSNALKAAPQYDRARLAAEMLVILERLAAA